MQNLHGPRITLALPLRAGNQFLHLASAIALAVKLGGLQWHNTSLRYYAKPAFGRFAFWQKLTRNWRC
jgi:hypothetical protein